MGMLRDRAEPFLYELLGRRFEEEFGEKRRAVLARARGRVLEIGAGTGFNLRHYPAGIEQLVITEPAAGMLRRAKRRAAELGRQVTAVQGPAERLPFEDDAFDTVVSTFVL